MSLRQGRRVSIPTPTTIADGLTHATPAPLPFEVNQALFDRVVTATDAEIVEAMAACFTHLKAVVEPSGACALAAAISGRIDIFSGTIGVVLSRGKHRLDHVPVARRLRRDCWGRSWGAWPARRERAAASRHCMTASVCSPST
ncbi:pyridoxal-phosphate dependent enzyme [Streptosporangium sp. CA-135522]|uniref:pyridoxal-phosphate dependent enzyme n=1 Tax=Streptosporangium sp. CA-135522 TaxID=3240072 RepID=UPI003D8D3214